MLSVKSIKDNKEYLKEYFKLSSLEWGEAYKRDDFEDIIDKRASDVLNGTNDNIILVLGLFDNKDFIGFISLFKYDDNYDYIPWYATMYVKSFPTHYLLEDTKKIKGSVLCEQIRSIDYEERLVKYVEHTSDNDLLSVIMLTNACIEN